MGDEYGWHVDRRSSHDVLTARKREQLIRRVQERLVELELWELQNLVMVMKERGFFK